MKKEERLENIEYMENSFNELELSLKDMENPLKIGNIYIQSLKSGWNITVVINEKRLGGCE